MSESVCVFIPFNLYPGTYQPSGHINVSYGCGCGCNCYHRRYGIRTEYQLDKMKIIHKEFMIKLKQYKLRIALRPILNKVLIPDLSNIVLKYI